MAGKKNKPDVWHTSIKPWKTEMRAFKLLTILFLIVLLFSFKAEKPKGKEFYILFGSGFENDTVSLVVNDTLIIDKVVFRSDSIYGDSRERSIYFKNGSLSVFDKNRNIIKKVPFEYTQNLRIIIRINEKPYDLLAVMKKGKYIVISKHPYYYNIYLNQFKKPLILE